MKLHNTKIRQFRIEVFSVHGILILFQILRSLIKIKLKVSKISQGIFF